ncbi:hypothetical protein GCM10027162_37160 [Streptomyces incanus]
MPLSAYDTVLGETPARRATSVIFTIGGPYRGSFTDNRESSRSASTGEGMCGPWGRQWGARESAERFDAPNRGQG